MEVSSLNLNRIEYFAITGSVLFLLLIAEMVRKKRLKEEYSLLWIFFGAIFLLFSLWREGLDFLAQLIGVAYPPTALFLLLIMSIFSIMIHFSTIISTLSERNKILVQELGLLKVEVELLKTRLPPPGP